MKSGTGAALSRRVRAEGYLFFAAFCLTIPAANWMIGNVGTTCVPDGGPCLIPVGFGFDAPSGVLMIGFAFVLRDLVQRRLGFAWGVSAVLIGAAISSFLAPAALVIASGVAFLLSELADLLVYTPLQRRRFLLAVLASSAVGVVVDSAIFLYLAFGSLEFIQGQVLGKSWMVLLVMPLVAGLRARDRRLGIQPA